MGVWIEIWSTSSSPWLISVTPLVGVWIEMLGGTSYYTKAGEVTPLVGVWIEIVFSPSVN